MLFWSANTRPNWIVECAWHIPGRQRFRRQQQEDSIEYEWADKSAETDRNGLVHKRVLRLNRDILTPDNIVCHAKWIKLARQQ